MDSDTDNKRYQERLKTLQNILAPVVIGVPERVLDIVHQLAEEKNPFLEKIEFDVDTFKTELLDEHDKKRKALHVANTMILIKKKTGSDIEAESFIKNVKKNLSEFSNFDVASDTKILDRINKYYPQNSRENANSTSRSINNSSGAVKAIYGVHTKNLPKAYRNYGLDFDLSQQSVNTGYKPLTLFNCVSIVADRVNDILERSGSIGDHEEKVDESRMRISDFRVSLKPAETTLPPKDYTTFSVCYLKFSGARACTSANGTQQLLFRYNVNDVLSTQEFNPEYLTMFAQYLSIKIFQGISTALSFPKVAHQSWKRISGDLERALEVMRYAGTSGEDIMMFCSADVESMEKEINLMKDHAKNNNDASVSQLAKNLEKLHVFAQENCGDVGSNEARLRESQKLRRKMTAAIRNVVEDINGPLRVYVRIRAPLGINKKTSPQDSIWQVDPVKNVVKSKGTEEKSFRVTAVYDAFKKTPMENASALPNRPHLTTNYDMYYGWTEMVKDSVSQRYVPFDLQGVKPVFDQLRDGYNVMVMGYGYSGAGKTYTLFGTNDEGRQTPGITTISLSHLVGLKKIKISLVAEDYLEDVKESGDKLYDFSGHLHVIYADQQSSVYRNLKEQLQEVNKRVSEVVPPMKQPLTSKETKEGSTADDMHNWLNGVLEELEQYRKERGTIRTTPNNKDSSRSHLYMQFELHMKHRDRPSYLSVVDLAGRENPEGMMKRYYNIVRGVDNAQDQSKNIIMKPVTDSKKSNNPEFVRHYLMRQVNAEENKMNEILEFYNIDKVNDTNKRLLNSYYIALTILEGVYINKSLDDMQAFVRALSPNVPVREGKKQSIISIMLKGLFHPVSSSSSNNKLVVFVNLKNMAVDDDQETQQDIKDTGKKALEFAQSVMYPPDDEEKHSGQYSAEDTHEHGIDFTAPLPEIPNITA